MRAIAAAVLLVPLAYGSAARAEGPGAERCATAYESSQRLRQSSRLREAHAEALVCADGACPRLLRQDCARWVDEIERATPTLVIHATGRDGCDIVDGRVTIDDAPASDRPQGTALAVDPGVHKIRVEAPGGEAIEQKVVVVEGDHERRIELRAAAAGVTCGVARAEAAPPVGRPAGDRPTPAVAYALFGLGATALVAGTLVAMAGFVKRGDLDQCAPRCNPDDVDANRRTFVVSDILVGAGIVSLAVATYFYLTRPTTPATAAAFEPGVLRF